MHLDIYVFILFHFICQMTTILNKVSGYSNVVYCDASADILTSAARQHSRYAQ